MTDSVKSKLKEIGSNWKANQVISKSQDVVFTWMDSEKWSEWLKSMYGIQPTSNEEGRLGIIVAHHDVSILAICLALSTYGRAGQ